jgi:predicted dehydrogenase
VCGQRGLLVSDSRYGPNVPWARVTVRLIPFVLLMICYGILGFGLHAIRQLMPGFALATNSRVTALSRRDMKRAQASAAEYKIPNAFDSAADLSRSPEVDAIFVATPDCSHFKDVLLAIESGKPVLCEKPMGMNAGECRQMVETARRAKLLLGVAQVFRFERSTASLRERVAAGRWAGQFSLGRSFLTLFTVTLASG